MCKVSLTLELNHVIVSFVTLRLIQGGLSLKEEDKPSKALLTKEEKSQNLAVENARLQEKIFRIKEKIDHLEDDIVECENKIVQNDLEINLLKIKSRSKTVSKKQNKKKSKKVPKKIKSTKRLG